MRCVVLFLLAISIQGCSNDYCGIVDLEQFKREEELHKCYPGEYSGEAMDECVNVRHANFKDFYDEYGITYYELLNDFEEKSSKLPEAAFAEHGTYLLAKALYIAEPDDPNIVKAVSTFLFKGVNPFKAYKTEMAPVAYLIEGLGVSHSTEKTRRMWELVKKYYPPERSEISRQVDLYMQYCRVKY